MPVSVPPLPHDGLSLVIVWAINPYPGDVSDKLVTFTFVTFSGIVLHTDNLSPPLANLKECRVRALCLARMG